MTPNVVELRSPSACETRIRIAGAVDSVSMSPVTPKSKNGPTPKARCSNGLMIEQPLERQGEHGTIVVSVVGVVDVTVAGVDDLCR